MRWTLQLIIYLKIFESWHPLSVPPDVPLSVIIQIKTFVWPVREKIVIIEYTSDIAIRFAKEAAPGIAMPTTAHQNLPIYTSISSTTSALKQSLADF